MAVRAKRASAEDDELIERYIDPVSVGWGRSRARLRDSGVPVWALIGQLRVEKDEQKVAEGYDIPLEAMQAALAYYRRNRKYIDAFLTLNSE
jgi:uncharacterized protein (DUF433 family)